MDQIISAIVVVIVDRTRSDATGVILLTTATTFVVVATVGQAYTVP